MVSAKDKAADKAAEAAAEEAATRLRPAGRSAATPVSYTINLTGSSDDADIGRIRSIFERMVRALRAAGVTVGGVLSGNQAAIRDDAGELVPADIVHLQAADVEAFTVPDRLDSARSHKRKGETPDEVRARIQAEHEGAAADVAAEDEAATDAAGIQAVYDRAHREGILEEPMTYDEKDGVTAAWIGADGNLHEKVKGKRVKVTEPDTTEEDAAAKAAAKAAKDAPKVVATEPAIAPDQPLQPVKSTPDGEANTALSTSTTLPEDSRAPQTPVVKAGTATTSDRPKKG
jgi:hypothetical protein